MVSALTTSSTIIAMPIATRPSTSVVIRLRRTSPVSLFFRPSLVSRSDVVVVAQAMSAPLAVDIIAESAAASTSPRTPVGSRRSTIVAKASCALPRSG